jgi:hypothetical protein
MEFSPGIVDGCFILIDKVDKAAIPFASIVPAFPKIGSVRSELVLQTSQEMGWVVADESGEAKLTVLGARILEQSDARARFRRALLDYVERENPSWVQQACFGRNKVVTFAPGAIRQMIDECGLTAAFDDETVAFWDMLAAMARGQRDDAFTRIGREGERLSIKHEEMRTGVKPKWVAVDSSSKGYDVLSVASREDMSKCTIEVKATRQGLGGRFHLTRNEWDVASRGNNHLFHLWDLATNPPRLAVIQPAQMSQHVPLNTGSGEWESVEVPMRAFGAEFV